MKKAKWVLTFFLPLFLFFGLCAVPVSAKTISSAKADNIFFYATNADGKSVLLKVLPLSELQTISHGQADGKNYYISTTDNYPTTQYCEARGFTVTELVNYVKSVTAVKGASAVSFSGSDTMRLMATDSYGNYSRSWTYDELYGVERYYFEGLYDHSIGWNTGWEIAGEDSSKFGITLDEYNHTYKASDPYYADKRTVFAGGVETTVVLATESYSGRTTSETLVASTEPGIASYINANGGTVAGSLKKVISDEYALRLSLPMTEGDLMGARRTAYDNFKWIYNLRLDMTNAPAVTSLGTVAEAVPVFSLSGNTLTISFSCATVGAAIYYGDDGAPQTHYTKPIVIDVTGRDLSSNPVTLYAAAVKEGYDDGGVLTYQYPGMAPSFKTTYSGMTGSDLTFTAADGVSAADWNAWTGALNFITLKTPSISGYVTVEKNKYTIDNITKSITFAKSLFTATGSYSFIFHNTKYADKSVSVTMKQAAPTITVAERVAFGLPITITFANSGYRTGLSAYVTPEGGTRTMISSNYLDRTQAGQVTIKAEYFTATSSAMPGEGRYTLELVNNGFSPASQTVGVTLAGGGSFNDVSANSWYAKAEEYAEKRGLFSGTSPTTFSPDMAMTRAMFVTVLWRLDGATTVTGGADFTDVPSDAWYADAARWACVNSIVSGTGNGNFSPNASVSREQIAAILCRYAAYVGKVTLATGDLSKFTDVGETSAYALDSLRWAVGEKVISGTTDTTLTPQGTATRGQVAQMLMNYLEWNEVGE